MGIRPFDIARTRVTLFQALLRARDERGGKFKILEGPDKFRRFVVIEFPSVEQAVACYDSLEYLEAAAHRKKDGASELEIAIVEGI